MEYLLLFIISLIITFVLIFLPYGKCPRCGGKLKKSFFDASIDKQVYKCEDCSKEYI